jgi:uncharacterized protein (DUF58 family)
VFALLLFGVLVAAINTGNNLLYLVLSTQLAVLVLNNLLAEWNLRGVEVARLLPAELFAEEAAAGAWLVQSRRRWGAIYGLQLEEEGGEGEADQADGRAVASVVVVPAGAVVDVPARWTFPTRGRNRLRGVRVESSFPFGLVRRWRMLDAPADVLVYPHAAPGPTAAAHAAGGLAHADPRRPGRSGDFQGLRDYAPGDALHDLHWPTSARMDRPMVVVRTGEASEQVLVRVSAATGARWEVELARATGQVVRHFSFGHAVGLSLLGDELPPRSGAGWRRRLLERLAEAPHGPAVDADAAPRSGAR